MLNRGHTNRSRSQFLKLTRTGRITFTCDTDLQRQMRVLWVNKKHIFSANIKYLSEHYQAAFEKFIFDNKIPKLVSKIERDKVRLIFKNEKKVREYLTGMSAIALKRNQPLCIIIEEALQSYLDLPENYIGKSQFKPGKVQKL